MALRSTPHQSLASTTSASNDVVPIVTVRTYPNQKPWITGNSCELPSDTSLLDELNYFYARFEACNTEACMRAPVVPDDCVIMLSTVDGNKTFKQVNIHKATEPD